ncbi:MAG: protein-L-isoaspartate(D-aspartate) O-methyltransferase [Pseudomonadota bacterium]
MKQGGAHTLKPQNAASLDDDDRNAVVQIIMELRARGITDRRLLSALERIPREAFVVENQRVGLFENRPTPIGYGQTMTQTLLIGLIVGTLNIADGDKVLEVGTGSGFQSAVLAKLGRRIYSMERYRTLARRAEGRLGTLGITNVSVMYADGLLGWKPQAPFQRIVLNGSVVKVPDVLMDQLDESGCLIAPIGKAEENQQLTLFSKFASGVHETPLANVKFAALISGKSLEH